jgi:starch synthase
VRILTLCAEYAPLAKVGGLGDVTAGLSNWLARRGHQVLVVLPYYGAMRREGVRIEAHAAVGPRTFLAGDMRVPWSVHRMAGGVPGGPDVFLVDAPELFGSSVYESGEREALRFMLLSQAGLELAAAAGFSPDILHCHDWHAAPAAVMLRGAYRDERVFRQTYAVLTIHNIGYQGVFSDSVLERTDHGELRKLFAAEDLAADQINFLKAGIVHADALTTVSPTHAREIQTPEYGKGLDELLRQKRHRLAGILNGVDYAYWSPESDVLLPARYSAQDPGGKRFVREALLRELNLQAAADVPVVGLVSRLAEQKGIDLLIAALPALLRERNFVCAFLGSGEPAYVAGLQEMAQLFPGRVALAVVQDERLAHRVLSGSDIALLPSRYEPCGLTQLYALRYGTVPVVRMTGGLADTVEHFDPATGQGTGSVFVDADPGGVSWGLSTALDWFADRAAWAQLMRNGMRLDFSWAHQGPKYEELFARLGA